MSESTLVSTPSAPLRTDGPSGVADGRVRCYHVDWTLTGAVRCGWAGDEDDLIFDPDDECPDHPRLVCPECLTGDWRADEGP